MEKLKVGIIGSGQVAETSHLPSYLRNRDTVEVAAVCDTNRERAACLAQKFGVPAFYGSHLEMLEHAALDAVSVCVTNRYHAALTIDALNAGCHVLCEKPPAMNHEQALSMYRAAKLNGKILAFNFHFRHSEEVKTAKRLVDGGQFGGIYAARVQALRRRGIPGWGPFIDRDLQGGGPLIDIGIHMLDAALYLMGFPEPEFVMAATHRKIGDRPGIGLMGPWDHRKFTVEDSAFGFIRFAGGVSLNLECSFALNMKEKSLMNVHLFGDRAGASLFPLELYSEMGAGLSDTAFPHMCAVDRHFESISDFVSCCRSGKEPLCRAEDALMIQKLTDALYRSAETGMPVKYEPAGVPC